MNAASLSQAESSVRGQAHNTGKRRYRIRTTYGDILGKSLIQVKYTYMKTTDSAVPQPQGHDIPLPVSQPPITVSSDDSDLGKKHDY